MAPQMGNPSEAQLLSQVNLHSQAIYRKMLPSLISKHGGSLEAVPPDQLQSFKNSCITMARQAVSQQMRNRQQQAMQQQQQHSMMGAQQVAMQQQQQQQQQNMGGMMHQGM